MPSTATETPLIEKPKQILQGRSVATVLTRRLCIRLATRIVRSIAATNNSTPQRSNNAQ